MLEVSRKGCVLLAYKAVGRKGAARETSWKKGDVYTNDPSAHRKCRAVLNNHVNERLVLKPR